MKKYSIELQNHKTSISLETEFISELKNIAKMENKTIPELITQIDIKRLDKNDIYNLSSAIRIFILDYIKTHK